MAAPGAGVARYGRNRAGGGLSAQSRNSLRNQTFISRGECIRSRQSMTLPEVPDRGAGAAHTVRVSEDRDGQRVDNFLLGHLKGAPRSLVYKLIRSGQEIGRAHV